MTRFRRKFGALLALVVLLFTQLAIAAYACPSAGDAEVFVDAPCHGMDRNQANLCKQHCEQGSQSFDRTAPAVVDVPVSPLIAIAVLVPHRILHGFAFQTDLLAYEPGPPLLIRHCSFQI